MQELRLTSPGLLEFMRIGHKATVGESEVSGCRPRILAGTYEEGVCAVGMRHEYTFQPGQERCWSFRRRLQTCTAI